MAFKGNIADVFFFSLSFLSHLTPIKAWNVRFSLKVRRLQESNPNPLSLEWTLSTTRSPPRLLGVFRIFLFFFLVCPHREEQEPVRGFADGMGLRQPPIRDSALLSQSHQGRVSFEALLRREVPAEGAYFFVFDIHLSALPSLCCDLSVCWVGNS